MWALYFHLSARGTHLVSVASVPAVASILAFAIEVTWPSNRTTSSALGMLIGRETWFVGFILSCHWISSFYGPHLHILSYTLLVSVRRPVSLYLMIS